MKTSTVVWTIIVVIVIIGVIWWLASGPSTAPTSTTGSTATTTVPGGNLTLGEGTDPNLGQYLVAYNGMTLYEDASDTPGVSTCTGSCATTWPPYTVSTTSGLAAESPISGTIATITRGGGSLQVTYNGMPLYFYSGDTAPGDDTGIDVSSQWKLATP